MHKALTQLKETLFKVVSMLIHHLVSAGNLHAKDFISRKKKKNKINRPTVQTVVGIGISAKTIKNKKKNKHEKS